MKCVYTIYKVQYRKYDIRGTKYAALQIFCIKVKLYTLTITSVYFIFYAFKLAIYRCKR